VCMVHTGCGVDMNKFGVPVIHQDRNSLCSSSVGAFEGEDEN
jgi:hypothetical protein